MRYRIISRSAATQNSPVFPFGLWTDQRSGQLTLIDQRVSLCIAVDLIGQYQDALDQSPYPSESAGHKRHDDLGDPDPNEAEIKTMNAQAAKHDSENSRDGLGLAR